MRNKGFTLVELLMAIAVTGMVALLVAALTNAVSTGGQYVQASQQASQHALAVLDYLRRQVAGAYATAAEPGVMVVRRTGAGWEFPDTLVVWSPPGGQPANPAGTPLVEELLLFCPDPDAPERLIQVRAAGDKRPVSLWELNTPTWQAELDRIKRSPSSQRMLLCEGVRVVTLTQQDDQPPAQNNIMNQRGPGPGPGASPSLANTGGGTGLGTAPSGNPNPLMPSSQMTSGGQRQGAVFFSVRFAPSQQELESVSAGTLAWEQAAWPQGMFSTSTGLRQVWVAIELQLSTQSAGQSQEVVLPFFGSATRYYQVNRDEL